MDKEVKESIQKFEDKTVFVRAKLQTRQSFREDQQALERRLSKYRQAGSNDKCKQGVVTTESDKPRVSVNGKSAEHSTLENIVMEIRKEQKEERTRTLSETTDKEDSEIDLPDNVIVLDGSADKSVNQNGLNGSDKSEVSANGNTGKINGHDTGVNSNAEKTIGHAVKSDEVVKVTDVHVKANGHAVLNGSASLPPKGPGVANHTPHKTAHNSNSLPNGHSKGSLTPEPRLKLRGTRLYEKNSKLTASSSDHLDKISLRGGTRSATHGYANQPQLKKTNEQVLVPVVAGAEVTSLPRDGNLKSFSVEEMVSVFRMLHLPEQLIYRLATNKVDGKRFSAFTDKELETLGMINPVIRYFRDKSTSRKRSGFRKVFML